MNKIYEYKGVAMPLEVKDVDSKQGIVTGYFSAFNSVDIDRDVIRKGAFAKTIRDNGPKSSTPRIKHLLNHDSSKPIALLQDLKEDDYGLLYESKIGTHQLGKDFIQMVESGLVTEHSIGYTVVKRNQVGNWEDGKNTAVWELVEIKLYEGSSLTGWGANQNTPLLGMKGIADVDKIYTRITNLEKFCRNTTASDECIELCLLEIKQLGQVINDLTTNSTQAAAKALEPQKGKGINADTVLSFIKLKEHSHFN